MEGALETAVCCLKKSAPFSLTLSLYIYRTPYTSNNEKEAGLTSQRLNPVTYSNLLRICEIAQQQSVALTVTNIFWLVLKYK